MMNNTNVNWRSFKDICPHMASVLKVVLLIVIADIALSIFLSFFLSDAFYFKRYMKGSDYDEMVNNYHNKTLYVQPHVEAGWLNTPNHKEGDGLKWTTDSIGSRVSPLQKTHSPVLNADNLVFLLGSSVIDGYALPFEQSPAGFLNEKGYTAVDFGMSMYSIDQSYAFYKSDLSKYKPKVLVVGLHSEAEYISNMFVPFRHDGKYTPFLKPAYYLTENAIEEFQPPFEFQQQHEITEMLAALEKHDIFFSRFKNYKRLSLLPFSNVILQTMTKVNKNFYDKEAYIKAVDLQMYFMRQLTRLANKNGTEVIFVKFETLNQQKKPIHKTLLTTLFNDRNTLHSQLLRDKSFNILYISDMFKESGRPLSEFYMENDPVHLTAVACQLLAFKVDQEIQRIKATQKTQLVKGLN
jgi:hypothetical protein